MSEALTERNKKFQHDYEIYQKFLRGKGRITREIVELVNQVDEITHQQLFRLKKKFDADQLKSSMDPGRQRLLTDQEIANLAEDILYYEPKVVQSYLKTYLLKKGFKGDISKWISLKYVYDLRKRLKQDEDMSITERFSNNNYHESQSDFSSNDSHTNSTPFNQACQFKSGNLSSGMSDEDFSLENPSCFHPFQQCPDPESLVGEWPSQSEQRQTQNSYNDFQSNLLVNPEEKRKQNEKPFMCDSFIEEPYQFDHSIENHWENPFLRRQSDATDLNQSQEDKPPILDKYTNEEDFDQQEIDYICEINE